MKIKYYICSLLIPPIASFFRCELHLLSTIDIVLEVMVSLPKKNKLSELVISVKIYND